MRKAIALSREYFVLNGPHQYVYKVNITKSFYLKAYEKNIEPLRMKGI